MMSGLGRRRLVSFLSNVTHLRCMGGGGASAGSHWSLSPADQDNADEEDDDHGHHTADDPHCHVHLAAGSLQ